MDYPLITLFLTHAACAAFGVYITRRAANEALAECRRNAITAAHRQFELGYVAGQQAGASIRRAHARV